VDYLAAILDVLGPTGIVVPTGMPTTNWRGQAIGENAAKTTVMSAHGGSGVNAVATYQPGGRPTWAKQTYYRGRGRVPILPFNGTSEYLTIPDGDYFSSIEPAAFSVGCLVEINDASVATVLFGKDNQGIQREWDFGYSLEAANSKLGTVFRDQSAAVFALRRADAVLPNNKRLALAMTYNGVGGAAAADGVTLYVDGEAVAASSTNNASYVALENLTASATIGATAVPNSYHAGLYYGGVGGPWMAKVQLTADQMRRITTIQLAALKGFGPDYRRLLRR